MAIQKIYVTRERKRLDNGHNDSRYTLKYFIDEGVVNFIKTKFPTMDVPDYANLYGMSVQEVYDDTRGFAVVQYDDAIQNETTFMTAINKLVKFMGITKKTKNQARNILSSRFTEVSLDVFEIQPEVIDQPSGFITPSSYIYI